MDKKQKFIYTMDKSIADRLKEQGFTLLSDNNGNYIFMNNGVLTFKEDENQKNILSKWHIQMYYASNILSFEK